MSRLAMLGCAIRIKRKRLNKQHLPLHFTAKILAVYTVTKYQSHTTTTLEDNCKKR